MTRPPAVVVIGASAGGVEALLQLVAGLPADLPAAVCVVLHTSPGRPSLLPELLNRRGALPARHPQDGEPLQAGTIYCAPADHHLLVTDSRLRVTRGPRENNHRPAIDPLFRAAARHHGRGVVGVLLSGADGDGSEGLIIIKQYRGMALVQNPAEAMFPRMPESAIRQGVADAVLPVAELAVRLVEGVTAAARQRVEGTDAMEKRPDPEATLAQVEAELTAFQQGTPHGTASGFTCPLCGGGIWQATEDSLLRFHCHEGHSFSPDSFVDVQGQLLETTLWYATRALAERVALLRQLGVRQRATGQTEAARRYDEQAQELQDGVALLRDLLQRNGYRELPE